MASSTDVTGRVVLIPIDDSVHCERAYKWYVTNMHRPTDHVKFVHVIEPIYTAPTIGLGMESPNIPDFSRLMEETTENGKRLGQKFMRKAKEDKVQSQAFLHVDSKPGTSVIKAVQEHGAHLILMGSRGLSMVRRTILGSISDYVLHHSHIPVVIIPPENK